MIICQDSHDHDHSEQCSCGAAIAVPSIALLILINLLNYTSTALRRQVVGEIE